MTAPRDSYEGLEGTWRYLGQPVTGMLHLALLPTPGGLVAPIFCSPEAVAPFLAQASEGLEIERVEADDHRAKEEWLRAALEQGAVLLAFDPDPATLEPAAVIKPITALRYILSLRRHTACL